MPHFLTAALYKFVELPDYAALQAPLLACCEANGVNPIEYLRDVLLRISSHPATRIDDLLPDRWKAAESA